MTEGRSLLRRERQKIRVDEELGPSIRQRLGRATTDRMQLRPFTDTDADGLTAVFVKPKVWRFPYGRGFTPDETSDFVTSQLQHWDRFGFGCWVAELAENHRIIGYIGLSVPQFLPEILPAVEVGWRLDPEYWGRGLASEGARAALHEGFTTMGLDEILASSITEPPVLQGVRADRHALRPFGAVPRDRQTGSGRGTHVRAHRG